MRRGDLHAPGSRLVLAFRTGDGMHTYPDEAGAGERKDVHVPEGGGSPCGGGTGRRGLASCWGDRRSRVHISSAQRVGRDDVALPVRRIEDTPPLSAHADPKSSRWRNGTRTCPVARQPERGEETGTPARVVRAGAGPNTRWDERASRSIQRVHQTGRSVPRLATAGWPLDSRRISGNKSSGCLESEMSRRTQSRRVRGRRGSIPSHACIRCLPVTDITNGKSAVGREKFCGGFVQSKRASPSALGF